MDARAEAAIRHSGNTTFSMDNTMKSLMQKPIDKYFDDDGGENLIGFASFAEKNAM